MASSSLTHLVMKDDGECTNWAELPYELMSSILSRLYAVDILENAQKVCTSWRRVCKDPAMWRKIDTRKLGERTDAMFRHAVDLSQGGLLEIELWTIGSDKLLNYLTVSASNLRSFRLEFFPGMITPGGLTKALVKLPLLEELEVSRFRLWGDYLKIVGQFCPNLKVLKLHFLGFERLRTGNDNDALAIAETMHGLRFLQLVGNVLTDAGLEAILDNCPYLEHLDLRQCLNVNLVGDMEKRCSKSIKVLRRPNDSTHDYIYNGVFYNKPQDVVHPIF